MNYRTIFTLLLFVVFSGSILAQNFENPRTERRHGISYKAFGDPSILGIAYDIFLTNKINVEINVSGALPGFGTGVYYHPYGNFANRRWSFYTGIHYGFHTLFSNLHSLYFPAGFNYIGLKGFNFCIDAGFYHAPSLMTAALFSLKAGYRF
jgi:hypothetical protein